MRERELDQASLFPPLLSAAGEGGGGNPFDSSAGFDKHDIAQSPLFKKSLFLLGECLREMGRDRGEVIPKRFAFFHCSTARPPDAARCPLGKEGREEENDIVVVVGR